MPLLDLASGKQLQQGQQERFREREKEERDRERELELLWVNTLNKERLRYWN